MHEGVGEAEVGPPQPIVVAADILPELRASLGEVLVGGGVAGEHHVHEVRRPAEHAAILVGPELDHLAPAAQVVACPRLDVRVADALPAPVDRQAEPVLEVWAMLQGVQRGDRQGGAAQQRVRRHVHHPLAAEPDLAPVAQRLEKSGRGAKTHGGILRHRRQPVKDHPRSARREHTICPLPRVAPMMSFSRDR
jgi:hypothetical protein